MQQPANRHCHTERNSVENHTYLTKVFFVLFLLFFSDPSILTYTLTLRVREGREPESTKIHTVIRNDQESNANANVKNASALLQSPHGPGFPCQSPHQGERPLTYLLEVNFAFRNNFIFSHIKCK